MFIFFFVLETQAFGSFGYTGTNSFSKPRKLVKVRKNLPPKSGPSPYITYSPEYSTQTIRTPSLLEHTTFGGH
jgi:hypothetical protein